MTNVSKIITNLILDLLVFILGKLSYAIIVLGNLYKVKQMRKRAHIDPSVNLGDVYLDKNVYIGKNTYMNSGQIYAGKNSKVVIGTHCAIGYNVHIKARSHDPVNSRLAENKTHKRIESDITIGSHVWIGDNVFIKQGITIGNNVAIGANSVVTKNISDNKVVGGVPAKILYAKKERST